MVSLRSDNRVLSQNAKYAFLTNNYTSGTGIINLTSPVGFAVGDPILIGDMGQENTEIFKIGDINSSNGDVTLQDLSGNGATLQYGHAESSKVVKLPYNQVRFYWTAATGTISDENPVFSPTTPLSGWLDLDPTSFYTIYEDLTNSSGFGWFLYQNSITLDTSAVSNPIPYGGFNANTVANVFADFDSLMNVSELRLVTMNDKFSWLNEALAQLKNKLNLTNVEYTVSTPQVVTTVDGTSEYILPDDFGDLISVATYDPSNPNNPGVPIQFVPVYKIGQYNQNEIIYPGVTLNSWDNVRYYLRNRYIGFYPTPSSVTYYQYRYRAKASRVTSLSDYIDLPDNAFYTLKDWMLFRANQKFSNPSGANLYMQTFTNSVNLYMQASVKRDANLDSWEMGFGTNT